jgi:2-oxo-4-hydroxy-4-carboxy-5-ureidoimidazoline decarboxylase
MSANGLMKTPSLSLINDWDPEYAIQEFFRCCASSSWATAMVKSRPFSNVDELYSKANRIWISLQKDDWLEAFKGHSKIGDLKSLKRKFSNTQNWSSQEQAGVTDSSDEILIQLRDLNLEYEKKYGYIFIVCATGKTASEMLNILKERIQNIAETEIEMACIEQAKITRLRLEKML